MNFEIIQVKQIWLRNLLIKLIVYLPVIVAYYYL